MLCFQYYGRVVQNFKRIIICFQRERMTAIALHGQKHHLKMDKIFLSENDFDTYFQ